MPLAAVFTEKNSDNSQYERFVYVQQGGLFEKRTVKVGVTDFFYAEIQEGLAEGEVVSLELPKEEREKKKTQVAQEKKTKPKSTDVVAEPVPKADAAALKKHQRARRNGQARRRHAHNHDPLSPIRAKVASGNFITSLCP